jgi:pimeloyl-ACP methyl ester carboxylesterase
VQVIASSGHWLLEEQPAATVAAITAFLGKSSSRH